MDKRLERILPRVQKPARYVGGEFNAIMKDKSKVDTRVAFCFPDTYEIGMSNLGMRILYGVMNNIEGDFSLRFTCGRRARRRAPSLRGARWEPSCGAASACAGCGG